MSSVITFVSPMCGRCRSIASAGVVAHHSQAERVQAPIILTNLGGKTNYVSLNEAT